jgi:hypothetical protein
MIELKMYPGPPKRKKRPGARGRFQRIPRQLALAYGRSGTKTIIEQADDFAFCYAPYIQAAVREVGNNYHQVAKWLIRERIELPLDAGSAAMRSGTAAPDACHFRLKMTHSDHPIIFRCGALEP